MGDKYTISDKNNRHKIIKVLFRHFFGGSYQNRSQR